MHTQLHILQRGQDAAVEATAQQPPGNDLTGQGLLELGHHLAVDANLPLRHTSRTASHTIGPQASRRHGNSRQRVRRRLTSTFGSATRCGRVLCQTWPFLRVLRVQGTVTQRGATPTRTASLLLHTVHTSRPSSQLGLIANRARLDIWFLHHLHSTCGAPPGTLFACLLLKCSQTNKTSTQP